MSGFLILGIPYVLGLILYYSAQLSNYDSSAAQDGARTDSIPAEPVMHTHTLAANGLHLAER